MDRSWSEHGGDELASVAVEEQQREVLVLPEIAVIGGLFLGAMRRVVGAVQVEHQVRRHPSAFPLAQVDLP